MARGGGTRAVRRQTETQEAQAGAPRTAHTHTDTAAYLPLSTCCLSKAQTGGKSGPGDWCQPSKMSQKLVFEKGKITLVRSHHAYAFAISFLIHKK